MANYDLRPDTFVDRTDGQTKSFTVIDHTKKPKVYYSGLDAPSDTQSLTEVRDELFKELFQYPAVLCPQYYVTLLLRGEGLDGIAWNEEAARNALYDMDHLFNLLNLLRNTYNLMRENDPTLPIIE
jgi:hypothetical protein